MEVDAAAFHISDQQREALRGIEAELTCSLCSRVLVGAVSTRCRHHFCARCLDSHLRRASGGCPECGVPVEPRDTGPNTTIQSLVRSLRDMQAALARLDEQRRVHEEDKRAQQARGLAHVVETVPDHKVDGADVETQLEERETPLSAADDPVPPTLVHKDEDGEGDEGGEGGDDEARVEEKVNDRDEEGPLSSADSVPPTLMPPAYDTAEEEGDDGDEDMAEREQGSAETAGSTDASVPPTLMPLPEADSQSTKPEDEEMKVATIESGGAESVPPTLMPPVDGDADGDDSEAEARSEGDAEAETRDTEEEVRDRPPPTEPASAPLDLAAGNNGAGELTGSGFGEQVAATAQLPREEANHPREHAVARRPVEDEGVPLTVSTASKDEDELPDSQAIKQSEATLKDAEARLTGPAILAASPVMLGLTPAQRDKISSMLGKLVIMTTPDPDIMVTHVVMDADAPSQADLAQKRQPRATPKYLIGLALGAWILRPEWLTESLACGRWLDEAEFEVASATGVERRWRMVIARGEPTPFDAFNYIVALPMPAPGDTVLVQEHHVAKVMFTSAKRPRTEVRDMSDFVGDYTAGSREQVARIESDPNATLRELAAEQRRPFAASERLVVILARHPIISEAEAVAHDASCAYCARLRLLVVHFPRSVVINLRWATSMLVKPKLTSALLTRKLRACFFAPRHAERLVGAAVPRSILRKQPKQRKSQVATSKS